MTLVIPLLPEPLSVAVPATMIDDAATTAELADRLDVILRIRAAAERDKARGKAETPPTPMSIGAFRIVREIGRGGCAIVWEAEDPRIKRRVALKEYMPSSLAQRSGDTQVSVKSERHRDTFEAGLKSFVNEAKLLAQFDHSSLVKVYRFWEANGTAYMVMPLYEGPTLKQALAEMNGPPDEAWLMKILGPLSEALDVLHHEQCYHRDIAPDNVILLKGSGRPLLLDFGAARRVIGGMNKALTVILKPGYAPVEQYAEVPGMEQGSWTDVYALAASVYYAILGKTPPPAVGRLMNDSMVPLSQAVAGKYSERFLKAIDHALAVKPDERTQNIAQLRDELGLTGLAFNPNATQPVTVQAAGKPGKAGASGARSLWRSRVRGATWRWPRGVRRRLATSHARWKPSVAVRCLWHSTSRFQGCPKRSLRRRMRRSGGLTWLSTTLGRARRRTSHSWRPNRRTGAA